MGTPASTALAAARNMSTCIVKIRKFENVVARFLYEYLLSVMRSLGLLVCRAVKLSVFHSLTRNTHSISQTAQTGRTSLIVYEYSQFLVSDTSPEDSRDAAEKVTQIKHAAKSKHFYRHLPLMTSCFAVGCRFILYPVWAEAERGMQD